MLLSGWIEAQLCKLATKAPSGVQSASARRLAWRGAVEELNWLAILAWLTAFAV
jgi:hypothetical protein